MVALVLAVEAVFVTSVALRRPEARRRERPAAWFSTLEKSGSGFIIPAAPDTSGNRV